MIVDGDDFCLRLAESGGRVLSGLCFATSSSSRTEIFEKSWENGLMYGDKRQQHHNYDVLSHGTCVGQEPMWHLLGARLGHFSDPLLDFSPVLLCNLSLGSTARQLHF